MLNDGITKWDVRYMEIAKDVAKWSSCLRHQIGCVITVGNRIVATGYNGAPSGIKTCVETGKCLREDAASGTCLDRCIAAHAEQNALIQAAKLGTAVEGGTLYCTASPCVTCAKMIINSGIKRIVYLDFYPNELSFDLLDQANIPIIKLEVHRVG